MINRLMCGFMMPFGQATRSLMMGVSNTCCFRRTPVLVSSEQRAFGTPAVKFTWDTCVATTSSRHYTPLQALVCMSHPCLIFPLALSPVRILISLYSGKGHTLEMSFLQQKTSSWCSLSFLTSWAGQSWVDSGEGVKQANLRFTLHAVKGSWDVHYKFSNSIPHFRITYYLYLSTTGVISLQKSALMIQSVMWQPTYLAYF